MNLLDRALEVVAPQLAVKRTQARLALRELENYGERRFDGSSVGRRTAGWVTTGSTAAAEIGYSLPIMRNRSRDLVRNNPWAMKGIGVISSNAVSSGIVAKIEHDDAAAEKQLQQLWDDWAGSTDCDPEGQHTFYGLQATAMRTIPEAGELLLRKRLRYLSDGLDVPLQLQVLEGDFIDHTKLVNLGDNGRILYGVEYDPIGRRRAYWIYKQHPGDPVGGWSAVSYSTPADQVAHVFRVDRFGQVRGVPWLAPVIIKLRDFDEYEDAVLLRQKISNLYTTFVVHPEGADGIGNSVPNTTNADPATVEMRPGIEKHLGLGEDVRFADPPGANDYPEFSKVQLRAIAAGLGITYEALTGDLSNVNFSSGRMGWIEFHRNLEAWRWNMLIPQMCDPVFQWFLEAANLAHGTPLDARAEWRPPHREMIDPEKEIKGLSMEIRNGFKTREQVCDEIGQDADKVLDELEEDFTDARGRGILLDCDPLMDVTRGPIPKPEVGAAPAVAAVPVSKPTKP